MEIINAIILGVIQGLTEFLPVSSSGHLEIAKKILGQEIVAEKSLLMTVVLHFATALATLFVFKKEVISIFSPSTGSEIRIIKYLLKRSKRKIENIIQKSMLILFNI